MRGMPAGLFEGRGMLIVLADIAHQIAPEILDRGQDAAGNDVALDLGEPEFDLMEPRRIVGVKCRCPLPRERNRSIHRAR